MAQQKKSKEVGRPKLPKGEAKGRIVPVRFTSDEVDGLTIAAKRADQTVSEIVRLSVRKLLADLTQSNQDLGSRSNESRQTRKGLRSLGHRGGLRNSDANTE